MIPFKAPSIAAIAAQLPPARPSTEELISATRDRLSGPLISMLSNLGVEHRHSVVGNYGDVLVGRARPRIQITGTELASRAARRCLEHAYGTSGAMRSIGLVLGVSTAPGRLLPSLACDLLAHLPQIPRTAATLSISYMGCSALAKAVDTARWFLTCHPDQQVLVVFLDVVTPLSPPFARHCVHFAEGDASTRQATVDVMHGFLFGDAAVAILLEADGPGPRFGQVTHLTNERAQDAELGVVPDGGSDIPLVHGRRAYLLSPDVPQRGRHYASLATRTLLQRGDCPIEKPAQASTLLLHTGSKKILDALCAEFAVHADSEQVACSYRTLREYGNTIGCSVPLILADPAGQPAGHALIVAFGLSFAAGATTLQIPPGGWTPAHT